jgi:hypothetical protein
MELRKKKVVGRLLWLISEPGLPRAVSFLLVAYLAYSWTLKMETVYSSETTSKFTGLQGVKSQKMDTVHRQNPTV